MADITQLLQQMLNAPERSMARIDKQNVTTLARILTSSNARPGNASSSSSQPSLQIPAAVLTPKSQNSTPSNAQQSRQLQGAGWQWPNPPKALLAQVPPQLSMGKSLQLQVSMPSDDKPVVKLVITQSQSQHGAQKANLQGQVAPTKAQVAKIELPITQLPPKLVKALVDSVPSSSPPLKASAARFVTPKTHTVRSPAGTAAQSSGNPAQFSRGIAIKQAHQLSPQQFQYALKTLVTQIMKAQPAVQPEPAMTTATKTPELSQLLSKLTQNTHTLPTNQGHASNTVSSQATQTAATLSTALQSPSKAIEQLIKVVLQQQPSGESMQRPEALQRWVSDWFAARPVSVQSSHQMGSLGQMLMTLLGLSLQQNGQQQSSSPATSQAFSKQFTEALLQQVLRPSPDVAGDVRERINQLLLQLPQQQLQRLLQLFTGVLNSAQSAQARLQDSPIQQPEYFILLPTDSQKTSQNELLIRPEREPDTPEQEGRTLWLFTLRFELEATGPLLVKGRYHPQGSSVDFYAESQSAQKKIEQHLEQLEKRLSDLDVNSVNFRVQQGQIPDTLATQQSGIIRVKV